MKIVRQEVINPNARYPRADPNWRLNVHYNIQQWLGNKEGNWIYKKWFHSGHDFIFWRIVNPVWDEFGKYENGPALPRVGG